MRNNNTFNIGIRGWRLGLALGVASASLCACAPNPLAEDTSPLKELPRATFRYTPPLFEEWTFEQQPVPARVPGFSAHTLGHGRPGQWTITKEVDAPSHTHALVQATPCHNPRCYQVLVHDTMRVEYVDLSVGILSKFGTPTSAAGLVLGMQDLKNFYAVLVYPASNTVKAYRFSDGEPVLIKAHPVAPKTRTPWHFLRVQRNTIMSKDFLELSFDNKFFLSVNDSTLQTGQIGFITTGDGIFAFDNLRVVELVTSRPLSRPPAY